MSIVNNAIKKSINIWDKCISTQFFIQMQNGSLKKEYFIKYIIQDSLYLRDYIKTYSYGLIKSSSWENMKMFASAINYINDTENLTRINYLKDFNLNDNDIDKMLKSEECKNYTNFLLSIGKYKDIPSILMAILPCMLSYNYVFDKISKLFPHLLYGYYAPLINDYIKDEYKQVGIIWTNFTDNLCLNFNSEKIINLIDIFYQASVHELLFWEMITQ